MNAIPTRSRRLVLHVGQHKTGTSTLQYRLMRNRKALERNGFLYPDINTPRIGPRVPAHHSLLHGLYGDFKGAYDIERRLGARPAEASDALYHRVLGRARRGDIHTVILSSEAFFRPFDAAKAAYLGSRLSQLAEDVVIVCYVRHPADFVLSALSTTLQRVPSLSFHSVRNIVKKITSYPLVPHSRLDVLPFDRNCLKGNDIVADFAHRYAPDAAHLLPKGATRLRNQTLSPEAMHVAQSFTRAVGARKDAPMSMRHILFRLALRRADQSVPGFSRPKLRQGLSEEIQRHSRGYGEIRDRFGCTIPGIDYDIAGKGSTFDLDDLTDVEQVCEIDHERRATLRRKLRMFFPR